MHDVVQAAAPPVTAHVPLMTLAGLRKSFGPVQALKGVDVLIMPGEIHAIVGENGAGKSTLIGIAAGVLQADAGAIYNDGKYVEAPDPRRMREGGVSAVYQHPALAPDLTVLENLQLAAPSLAGPGGAEAADGILARIAPPSCACRSTGGWPSFRLPSAMSSRSRARSQPGPRCFSSTNRPSRCNRPTCASCSA